MNANEEKTKGMRQWRFDSMAEMKIRLSSDGKYKNAFERLSPGKQREYADYISEAKRVETKESRLEKITPMIADGVGLHDKYKNC